MNDQSTALAIQQSDNELIDVLCSSLYPGAKRESAALVLGYCRAAGIDPMLKPVHIVPMRTKTGEKDNYGNDRYEMRDTIMPGIGLYRIQAARTGQYAGQDVPEFGPTRTLAYQRKKVEWVHANPNSDKKVKREDWINDELEYPEWCAITIYRIVGGHRAAFTALEYWTENYATAGRDSDAPNEMWSRRTRGQLAKCAEAQALRKAFPEVGAMPTADEMEGRIFDVAEADPAPEFSVAKPRRASEVAKAALPTPTEPDIVLPVVKQAEAAIPVELVPAQEAQAPQQHATEEPAGKVLASEGECLHIIKIAKAKGIDLGQRLREWNSKLDPSTLAGMTKKQYAGLKEAL